jgi:hypothetical protein
MMQWFRRQRLVAALLILANPALVGSWVAAYHPCPVQDGAAYGRTVAPSHVAVASEHAGHEGMVMEEAPAPAHDHSQNDGHCSCIGQCLMAGIALPLDAGRESLVATVITRQVPLIPQSALAVPVSAPQDFLPPSSAPPIA